MAIGLTDIQKRLTDRMTQIRQTKKRQTNMDRQADRQTDKQTDRQTERQTEYTQTTDESNLFLSF